MYIFLFFMFKFNWIVMNPFSGLDLGIHDVRVYSKCECS